MAEATTAGAGGMTRREFLYYIWGASLALFTAEFTGLMVWFMLPRFREGEFGGRIPVVASSLPEVNDEPLNVPEGRFWLVNLDSTNPQGQERMYQAEDEAEPIIGVAAIYKVCTHLGCIYNWTPTNNRFECPCHGSKYRLDGRRIESPAPRTLDRFKIYALDADDNVVAESPQDEETGFYLPLVLPPETVRFSVDTGDKKEGPKPQLLCEFTGNCP
ncbi:MAG: ubiquinol-cytochrome c reductase iron-sulfur subunit [Chloroflexi bacterium]|nr:ubiquinol-cytochrome c reductase iron-sulfur subunit [Chloroflexota bacterium]MCI0578743.1 ubiquinol-cytochrome c reductase iron-sulfur subunit [Chloroflexota bacterium]MCI0643972.1 ubiquinol-cytochrome c reductase iron-sulfur subunit [Chloroflexota bacterium]MCI0732029.1 ubiquinol-cytochrome c reductase iron-sulfur subunit [Chloroflexota bacterium]